MTRGWTWTLVVLAIAAPTAGDIGSCGQEVVELDPAVFFSEKAALDCERCRACGFDTRACDRACGDPPATEFDPDCYPLVHDGEVCLRALEAAACEEYAAYVDDVSPTVPTECNFCPLSERPPTGTTP